MTVTVMSSCECDQDVSHAKRAADEGPVVINDTNKPAYVLLRYDEYRKLGGRPPNLRGSLVQRGGDVIDFEPPRLGVIFRPADFS